MRTITKTILEAARDGIKKYGEYYLVDQNEVYGVIDADGVANILSKETPAEAIDTIKEILSNHERYCDKSFAEKIVYCIIGCLSSLNWQNPSWFDEFYSDEVISNHY